MALPLRIKPKLNLSRMTRSGLRRYPRSILRSLREPDPRAAVRAEGSALAKIDEQTFAAGWLGHATALVRIGGLTVLTDPVLSHRIGMRLGRFTLGLDRLQPLPVCPEALKPVDVILISHAHFDHLDKPSLKRLADPRTTVITSRSTRRLIPRGFGDVIELDWDAEREVRGVRFTAIRPAHWGARHVYDRHRGFNSYLMRAGSARGGADSVFFGGDTAFTRSFDRLSGVRLAILGIGAYEPWIHAHSSPEEAWSMFQGIDAECMMPVHHATFELSDEPINEPMDRLLTAAGRDADRIVGAEAGTLWAA